MDVVGVLDELAGFRILLHFEHDALGASAIAPTAELERALEFVIRELAHDPRPRTVEREHITGERPRDSGHKGIAGGTASSGGGCLTATSLENLHNTSSTPGRE